MKRRSFIALAVASLFPKPPPAAIGAANAVFQPVTAGSVTAEGGFLMPGYIGRIERIRFITSASLSATVGKPGTVAAKPTPEGDYVVFSHPGWFDDLRGPSTDEERQSLMDWYDNRP